MVVTDKPQYFAQNDQHIAVASIVQCTHVYIFMCVDLDVHYTSPRVCYITRQYNYKVTLMSPCLFAGVVSVVERTKLSSVPLKI